MQPPAAETAGGSSPRVKVHTPPRCVIDGSLATLLVALAAFGYLAVVGTLALVRKQRPIFPFAWEHPLGIAGFALLVVGNVIGLGYAPRERFMGDVGRILYVHVPAAWLAMFCFALAVVFALAYLFSSKPQLDSAMESACEVGVVEGTLLLVLGSVFAKPTWGVWWAWDARLTASAVMMLSFVGVLLLRGVVRDFDRRATWSAVATILAGVNLPVTYLSVKWFRSIHQTASETAAGSAIDPAMRWILYFNTWALFYVTVWFLARRWRLAEARAASEAPEPLPEAWA